MKVDLLDDLLALRRQVNDMIDDLPMTLAGTPQLLAGLSSLHDRLTDAANAVVETKVDLSTRGLDDDCAKLRAVTDQLTHATDVVNRVNDAMTLVSQATAIVSAIAVALL